LLRHRREIHAYDAFFERHKWHPAADLSLLEQTTPAPAFLLYPADEPRAALATRFHDKFLDFDCGFSWGEIDDQAAAAFVAEIGLLLRSDGAASARFG
jgi:hypothetical protein